MKLFGIAGYSGSGKTTLIEQLLPAFAGMGVSVSVIKHTHHEFDLDRPGKDSYRHREAGAHEVLLAGAYRWALLHELRAVPEPALETLAARMAPVDLILVEGFKREPIERIEVFRRATGKPPLYPDDPRIVALASDDAVDCALPRFALDAGAEIAAFIADRLGLNRMTHTET